MGFAARRVTALPAAFLVGAASIAGMAVAHAVPTRQVAVPLQVGPVADLSGTAGKDALEAEVLRLTNRARAHGRKCGSKKMKAVGSLSWSDTLGAAAHEHSRDMALDDYFSHTSLSGSSPFDRIRAAGYRYRAAGENIAAGRRLADPADVVRAWLNSPGHCKVIMNGRYEELGVGRVEGAGKYSVYWTQNFGTRL